MKIALKKCCKTLILLHFCYISRLQFSKTCSALTIVHSKMKYFKTVNLLLLFLNRTTALFYYYKNLLANKFVI